MTLRGAFRLQRTAECERRGRGCNAARSRLAKGIFSFLTKPDERAKRALLERRSFARKLARKKSLLNARRQRSAYAPSFPQVLSRAIAARLQAEYIPPLGPMPFGRTRAQQVACLPRARGRCPEGAEEVHELTGINMTRLQIFAIAVARAPRPCGEKAWGSGPCLSAEHTSVTKRVPSPLGKVAAAG